MTFKVVKKLLHNAKEKSENTKKNSDNHNFQFVSIKTKSKVFEKITITMGCIPEVFMFVLITLFTYSSI